MRWKAGKAFLTPERPDSRSPALELGPVEVRPGGRCDSVTEVTRPTLLQPDPVLQPDPANSFDLIHSIRCGPAIHAPASFIPA